MENKNDGCGAEAREVVIKLDLGAINRSAAARALRVDVAHVSRVLSGKRNPSMKLAKKMADYLGVSLDQLYACIKENSQVVKGI